MNNKLQRSVYQLIPFLFIGIAIALGIGLIIVFTHILLWGIIIGAAIWVVAIIKEFLFPKKSEDKASGRIIEHDKRD